MTTSRITTALDLLGALLLVAAAAVAALIYLGWPLALAVGGLGVLAVSWLIDVARAPRRGRGGRDE